MLVDIQFIALHRERQEREEKKNLHPNLIRVWHVKPHYCEEKYSPLMFFLSRADKSDWSSKEKNRSQIEREEKSLFFSSSSFESIFIVMKRNIWNDVEAKSTDSRLLSNINESQRMTENGERKRSAIFISSMFIRKSFFFSLVQVDRARAPEPSDLWSSEELN